MLQEGEAQTQKGRKNMRKENTEQAQILETIGEKKENINQEKRKTSLKGNSNDTEKYGIIEDKKLARYVKEQSTDYQKLPKVTKTKQNVTNITTATEKKVTARS